MRRILTIVLLIASTAFLAQADLLLNGDFQNIGGTTPSTGLVSGQTAGMLGNGGWDVFNTIPGWSGGPNGVELQADGSLPGSNQWVELDTHGFNLLPGQSPYFGHNSYMQQNYAAPSAGVYKIVADYKIRTDRAPNISGDLMINGHTTFAVGVFVNGIRTGLFDDLGATAWTRKMSDGFVLNRGEVATIKFMAMGWADSFGGLLDNISINLVLPTSVPEPGTFLLVGLGLAAAYFIRRRRFA